MAWYNLTAVNATGVLPLTQSINDLYMFGQLGNLLLLALFFITFISFMHFNNNPKLNMMFSSSIIAMFSIFFRLLNLIPDFTPFLAWGIFAVTIGIVVITK